MPYKLTPVVLLAIAMLIADAHADAGPDDSGARMFTFSGFGTLGLVHSSEDRADFTSNLYKPGGAGNSRDWSADVDSRLGGQVVANFTSQLSAVVQVISEQRYDNTYTPEVEWANFRYAFTPDFSVRFGRIVMPSFLVSDFRKVGYANPWARPPLEVYSLVPITKNDGVDASYRFHYDELVSTVQATYGGIVSTFPGGTKSRARHQWGVFSTTEYGPLTMHITYHQSNLDIEALHPLFDAFRQFGTEGVALANRYDCDGKLIQLGSVGASFDPGNWFLLGEWARSISHCIVNVETGWYVSSGYRFGKLTPYITYARMQADSNTSDPGLSLSALPPFLAGPAAGLNAGLNGILGSAAAQKTVSVGGRWDFAKNATLKVQFDHSRLGAGSPGVLMNTQPGFQPGGVLNVFSATVDFVF